MADVRSLEGLGVLSSFVLINLVQVIYAKSGENAKECEALILLAEVICSTSIMNINSLHNCYA